jgi:AraC-like DNA-binding protein
VKRLAPVVHCVRAGAVHVDGVRLLEDRDYLSQDHDGVILADHVRPEIIAAAHRAERGVAEVHTHKRTDLPVDAVARQVGFGTALSLRQHLRAAFGVSPAGYRRTYHTRPSAHR